MPELEINDRRKFTAEGERTEVVTDDPEGYVENFAGEVVAKRINGVSVTDAEVSKFLAEAPKVYDDPKPLNDRVLIKQHAAETVYAGTTFVIPAVAQKNPNAGIVIAIGPEVDAEKDCAPNDLVIFNRYSAEEITLDGEQFVHVSKHDIHLRQRVSYAVQHSS
jgi:co-chaperonin GroES (HSP10)